jgi:hypothetical protein
VLILSNLERYDIPTTGRYLKFGLKSGLGYGLLVDSTVLLSGQKLGYVEGIKKIFGIASSPPSEESAILA